MPGAQQCRGGGRRETKGKKTRAAAGLPKGGAGAGRDAASGGRAGKGREGAAQVRRSAAEGVAGVAGVLHVHGGGRGGAIGGASRHTPKRAARRG